MEKDYSSTEPLTSQPEFCTSQFGYDWIEGQYTLVALPRVCGKRIELMAFKGTGVCGEEHRKAKLRGEGKADPADIR